MANLTIKVEMFECYRNVFPRTGPFHVDRIIILAVNLFAVTTTSFLECFRNFKPLRESD